MSHQRNKRGPFSFRFAFIFLQSNWYHAQHPKYWVIPHNITVQQTPIICLVHCVCNVGMISGLKQEHEPKKKHQRSFEFKLQTHLLFFKLVLCSSSNILGHLSSKQSIVINLLFQVHCMEDELVPELKQKDDEQFKQKLAIEHQLQTHFEISNLGSSHLPIFWIISHIAVSCDKATMLVTYSKRGA